MDDPVATAAAAANAAAIGIGVRIRIRSPIIVPVPVPALIEATGESSVDHARHDAVHPHETALVHRPEGARGEDGDTQEGQAMWIKVVEPEVDGLVHGQIRLALALVPIVAAAVAVAVDIGSALAPLALVLKIAPRYAGTTLRTEEIVFASRANTVSK